MSEASDDIGISTADFDYEESKTGGGEQEDTSENIVVNTNEMF